MASNPYETLFGHVDPGRPCLLAPAREWTYGEVAARAASFAGALAAAGVGAGDRVVVQVDKSVDAVALYLACLRRGAVYVPLNVAYTADEVAGFVEDAGPRLVVTRPGLEVGAEAAVVATLGTAGEGTFAALADESAPVHEIVPRDDDDWAAMLYTSGTTGRSKGAMLSVRNLTSNAAALVEAWRFVPDDVLVHVLPIFHVHGLFVALHCAWSVGATTRFHQRFDVDAVVNDLPRSTVFMGVPTHYHRLLGSEDLDGQRCAAMRLFTSGSAPLPAHEHDSFASRTGHRIVERYGMTETMILTSNPYDGERVAGTVGMPLPRVELRITDDEGRVVAPDTTGGVEVRTPGLFLGYWRQTDATAASMAPQGWFRTGDVGSLDREGRLTLAGRSSDLIISGGLNVYPTEIEQVLDRVPGVDESAVVGVADPDLGETVVAVVVADAAVDDDALAAACAPLSRFKHPKRFVRADVLPRNAMGKVQKADLRQMLQAE